MLPPTRINASLVDIIYGQPGCIYFSGRMVYLGGFEVQQGDSHRSCHDRLRIYVRCGVDSLDFFSTTVENDD